MTDLLIRPARPGEAGLVFGFVRALAEFEKIDHQIDATEAMIDAALFGPAPRVFCQIAEWEGRPAGFAMWFYTFSTLRGRGGIYLEDLFVEPVHRGRGIGKALLAALAQRCVAEGLARLEWSVLDWNEPAIGFYESLGAVRLTDWTRCRLTDGALHALGGRA